MVVTLLNGVAAHAATPTPRLLVFWESECAVCQKEIMRIPLIARQNPNLQIELITLQDGPSLPPLPAGSPSNVRMVLGSEATKIQIREYGNPSVALPFSVGLHSDGSYCQRYFGLLGIDRAKSWAQSC